MPRNISQCIFHFGPHTCFFILKIYVLSNCFFKQYKCTLCLVSPVHRDGVLQPKKKKKGSHKIKKRKNSWSALRLSSLFFLPVKWLSGICPKLGELRHAFYLNSRFRDKALGSLLFKVSEAPSLSSVVPQTPLHLSCSLVELVYLTLPGVCTYHAPFISFALKFGVRMQYFPLSSILLS